MSFTHGAAVIGTGRMGSAMAARLRGAGIAVVVYNRTRERALDLASRCGVEVAATAREAAYAAPVVLVSLADDLAAREAYAGPDGIAAGVSEGVVVADTSTVDPLTSAATGELVRAAGAGHLDAPVSGSVPSVERGELAILAGGDAADVERARPVLEHLATRIFHLGPAGSGAVMKLAVNSVLEGFNQALSEGLVLAERAGIDRAAAYEVFAASAIAAPFVNYKKAAFLDPDGTPVAFTLDLVAKDLDLVLGLARRVGVPMRQAATTRAAAADAIRAGWGSRDLSAMAAFLRDRGADDGGDGQVG
jgi:3-hydroxyisobutyrate dehydrogenase/2-hydroxy-3-oxopropionate reductase